MRIRGEQLKKRAAAANMTLDQVAEAIVEKGFDAEAARSAVRNWAAGRDYPRCKAKTIARIAQVLGVQAKDIARFTSEVLFHRGSPRKAKLLVDLVRGKTVDQALNMLTFTTKRAAINVKKALSAAIADAELAEADVTRLFIAESRVSDGPRIKRFQPKDRGRAHPITKCLSHITIGVEEKAN